MNEQSQSSSATYLGIDLKVNPLDRVIRSRLIISIKNDDIIMSYHHMKMMGSE